MKGKLTYISNSIIPSTTANSVHVMKMCNALSSYDCQVELYAPRIAQEEKSTIKDIRNYYDVTDGFSLRFLSYPSIFLGHTKAVYYSIKCFVQALKNLKTPDDYFYGRNITACCLLSIFNKKGALEIHSTPDKFAYYERFIFNLALKRNKLKLVVISDALKSLVLEYCKNRAINVAIKNILTLHDAADAPVEDVLTTQNIHLQGQASKTKIGYIGHLYQGRGVDIIIESARLLPGYEFHIVGGTIEDINFWKVKGLPDNLFFYGHVEPRFTAAYRCSFDILLAPYQNKVSIKGKGDTSSYMSPLKIFEYMSSRRPLICSDLPVLREVLNDDNSILVKCDSVSEWVDAINKLVADKDLMRLLSESAYDDFKSKYTWSRRAEKILDFIRV